MIRIALACCFAACFSEPHPRPALGDANGDANGDAHGDGPLANVNFMFVTAQPHAISSLAEADTMCTTLAHDASLPGATYVAWLSDATHDARDRLGSARGWQRTDYQPFADLVSDVAFGTFYAPPRYDETGVDLGGVMSLDVATGTDSSGHKTPTAYFGSIGNMITSGLADVEGSLWTEYSQIPTTTPFRFYCFGTDYTTAVPKPAIDGKLVFVSSQGVYGDATIAAFDAACAQDQPGAIALVAVTGGSALSRLSATSRPWVRADGMIAISADATKLTAAIDVQADHVSYQGPAWSGAQAIDQPAYSGFSCSDWTGGTSALVGYAFRSTATVAAAGAGTFSCQNNTPRLYCAMP